MAIQSAVGRAAPLLLIAGFGSCSHSVPPQQAVNAPDRGSISSFNSDESPAESRVVAATSAELVAPPAGKQPPEYGAVRWLRDLGQGKALAQKTGRPIALLFQEVPGCATCRDFGRDVLSHPQVVEALEELFVPVLIHNNTEGDRDASVRKAYREPSWNNPVLRIVNSDGEDVVPRLTNQWSVPAVVEQLGRSLLARSKVDATQGIPKWLQALAASATSRQRGTEVATFGMHCFWEGEARLGKLDGVLSTKAGWLAGQEVVDVEFDPGEISYGTLFQEAQRMQCADTVFHRSPAQQQAAESLMAEQQRAGRRASGVRGAPGVTRPDHQPKYYLGRTPLRHVPMTGLQAARINAHLAAHSARGGAAGDARLADPELLAWLSPRQQRLLQQVSSTPSVAEGPAWPVVIDQPLAEVWPAVMAVAKAQSEGTTGGVVGQDSERRR